MSGEGVWLSTTLIVFVASTIQATTGFGFAVFSMPIMVFLLHPHEAVATNMLLSSVLVLMMWWRTSDQFQLPVGRSLFLPALLGLPIGLTALAFANLDVIRLGVGFVTILIVLYLAQYAIRHRYVAIPPPPFANPTSHTWLAGFVSGFLTGSLAMPGPPIVALLNGQGIPKTPYRATLNTYLALIYPIGLCLLLLTSVIPFRSVALNLSHIPALLLGIQVGNRLHNAISEWLFTIGSLTVLSCAAILCIWSGVTALLVR